VVTTRPARGARVEESEPTKRGGATDDEGSRSDPSVTPVWRSDLVLGLLVAMTAAVVGWLRMSPITRSTVWAEDGAIFLVEALRTTAPFGTVPFPYDGYLHLVPRVIAEIVTLWVPVERYAVALSAAACLVAAGLCAVVFVVSRDVVRSLPLRLLVGVLPMLVPSVAREVLGNIANLHWFFLWATPWLLLARARTRTGAGLLGVVALLATSTEVQAAYFAPLLLWQLKDRRTWPIKAGYLLGGAAQAWALLGSHRAAAAGPDPSVHDILGGYLVNAVMSLWVGPGGIITAVVADVGFRVAALLVIPSIVALVVAWLRGRAVQRVAVVTFTLASAAVWTGTMVINHPAYHYDQPSSVGQPELVVLRYAAVPAMFLLATMVIAVSTLPRHRAALRAVVAVLSIPIALAIARDFVPVDATRAGGPVWLLQVPEARQRCALPGELEEPFALAPSGHLTAMVSCQVLAAPG
jgi:hypothetical protein